MDEYADYQEAHQAWRRAVDDSLRSVAKDFGVSLAAVRCVGFSHDGALTRAGGFLSRRKPPKIIGHRAAFAAGLVDEGRYIDALLVIVWESRLTPLGEEVMKAIARGPVRSEFFSRVKP